MIQFLNEQDQNRHDTKEDTLMTMKAKFKDKRSHFLLSQSLPDVARRWSSEVLVFESSLHLGQEEAWNQPFVQHTFLLQLNQRSKSS